MITANYFEKGNLRSEIFSKEIKSKVLWLDLLNPTEEEMVLVANNYDITYSDIDRSIDEKEKPSLVDLGKFTRITLSIPLNHDDYRKILSPISFFINSKTIITIRRKDSDSFKRTYSKLKNKSKNTLTHPFHLTYTILEESVNDYFEISTRMEEQMNVLENELFIKINDKKMLKKIFDMKRKLMYLHKSLTQNREILILVNKDYVKQISVSETNQFRYLLMDVDQLIDMFSSQHEMITETVEIYVSNISNNLNEIMKKLTVYASYIIVPTFIASFYGMNFVFMPEIYWEYGYFFALGVMALSIIVMHLFFRKKGWT